MESKIASIITDLKAELEAKQKAKSEMTMSETTKVYKRMLTTDCLMLNALINRSTKKQLKRIQTKYREAIGDWIELFEEYGDEGEYLQVSNDCKMFNDKYDTLVHILGV
jgi:DNA repair photolyase